MNLKKKIKKIAEEAKGASYLIATASTDVKNKALVRMARNLEKNSSYLIRENEKDLKNARKENLKGALVERLRLNSRRIKEMTDCLREIAALPDPVGEIITMWKRPNGLRIGKIRVPLGVIAIIYESRPNVTSDCVGLCLKSGNSIILRGGREAFHSNTAIYSLLVEAVKGILPENAVKIIPTTERLAVDYLLEMDSYIDLLIPRGGESLIKYISRKARMPVIKHYKGVCHIYIDEDVDINMAMEVAYNAKVQRPGVCNAMETMLVHKNISKKFLPPMLKRFKKAGVEIRGCRETRKIFSGIKLARESDWYKEYLDLILSVKVVKSLEEAVEHIRKYGSSHSDAVITANYKNAWKFLENVDSACVYVNASTRFTDGYQFGLGAEMGISTDKIHARGPMGLKELTTYKYIILGNGQIRT